jgi:hypothetical protein
MGKRSHRQVKAETKAIEQGAKEPTENPLYGVAMLKVAMELKRPNAPPLNDIISAVLSKMKLSRHSFEAYLQKNLGLLRTIGPGGQK